MLTELLESTLLVEKELGLVGGWIHPDGKLELFSEQYEPGDHDYDALDKLRKEDEKPFRRTKFEAYWEYLSRGNIRYVESLGQELNIEILVPPTSSQMKTIGRKVREIPSFFYSIVGRVPEENINGRSWKEFIRGVQKLPMREE